MSKTSVINPFDHNIIGEVELRSEEDAMHMLAGAHKISLRREQWLSIPQRRDILTKLKTLLEKKREDIIKTAIAEGGKPHKDTVIEFERALNGIDVAIWELFSLKGEVIAMEQNQASLNRHAYTIKEPRGVVLAISAFNHPINLIIHQVIPCIATSCPVLVKPALKTPLTCKLIVDAIHEAGLDEVYCQYVPVENDVCEKLVANEKISFMSFIGSAAVGWFLRARLAPGAHCTLEHGGVAPVIIDQGYSSSTIMQALLRSCFYHAGQVCVSTQRIFVHEQDCEKILNDMKASAEKLVVGDPHDPNTDVGPLISATEVNRVASWVDASIKGGGQLMTGGKRVFKSCYEPTIIFNPHYSELLSTEEIFGPVVAVYSYQTIDEAITRANDTKYFFQASIFTNRLDNAFRAANNLQGRTVLINDHTAFRVDWMPFGGHRLSGLGVSGMGPAMRDLSIDKLLVFNFS